MVELTTVKRFYPFRVFVFYLFGKIVVRVVSHAFTQILERLIISYLSSESVRFTQFFSFIRFSMNMSRLSYRIGLDGLEPSTSRLSGARSNHLSYKPFSFGFDSLPSGGDDGNRTHDPLLAGQVLSQLSYTPI